MTNARRISKTFTAATIAIGVACAIAACGGAGSSIPVASGMHGSPARLAGRPHVQATEAPPSPSAYLDDTWNGIHVFLPFDNFKNKYIIKPAQAEADGPLYDMAWGSNSGEMVHAWQTNNPSLHAGYYLPIGTDALLHQFGKLGQPLTWWQANHPDWILYECDQKTIAYVTGLSQVPLD